MSDLIRREDALECFCGLDRMDDVMDAIAALPAVQPDAREAARVLLAYMDGGNEGPVSDFLRALIDKAKGERL
jgi:hypothetical protein